MRNVVLLSLILVLTLCVVPVFGQQGNDLPKGMKKMFSLQIIAYNEATCPQGDFLDTSRRQIAVKADVGANTPRLLSQTLHDNDILLQKGDDFRVLDGNACIDGVAKFQLPDPATSGDPTLLTGPTFAYQVWIRLVGKPNTGIDVATCAVDTLDTPDPTDDIVRCSVEEVEMSRTKPPKFQDVSKELLSVCADTDGDGACDTRVPLFGAAYYGFWWDWGTIGKAHAQLVFVEAR